MKQIPTSKSGQMTAPQIIGENNFIMVSVPIIEMFGLHASMILGHLISIQKYHKSEWFFQTYDQIEKRTGIKEKVARNAIETLIKNKILTSVKKGVPCKRYYFIDKNRLDFLIKTKKIDRKQSNSSPAKMAGLEQPKRPDKNSQNGRTRTAKMAGQEQPKWPDKNSQNGRTRTAKMAGQVRPKEGCNNTTNNNTKDNKILSKDNISDFKKIAGGLFGKETTYDDIPTDILKIIKGISAKGEWNHRTDPSKKGYTKTITQIYDTLKTIKDGSWTRNLNLDPAWLKEMEIKEYPEPKGYSSWEDVRLLIYRSVSRYIKHVKITKEKKMDSINSFFYNPITKKSQFLKWLNKTKETEHKVYTRGRKKHFDKQMTDKLQKLYDTHKDKLWDDRMEMLFWNSCDAIRKYYKDNKKILTEYNKILYQNGFAYHVGTLDKFMNFYIDWVENDMGDFWAHKVTPGRDSRLWQCFHGWLQRKYNFMITLPAGYEKEMEKGKTKQQEQEKELFEMDIKYEMDKLRAGYNQSGFTDWDESSLRKSAERIVNEKKSDK